MASAAGNLLGDFMAEIAPAYYDMIVMHICVHVNVGNIFVRKSSVVSMRTDPRL